MSLLRAGPHAVAVACAVWCRLAQVLHGHARTPWCVKFHPRDANLVASGCLAGRAVGGQVLCVHRVRLLGAWLRRVSTRGPHAERLSSAAVCLCGRSLWDVKRGKALKKITLSSHALSLAFHPVLPLVAVAYGRRLCVWDFGVRRLNLASSRRRVGLTQHLTRAGCGCTTFHEC